MAERQNNRIAGRIVTRLAATGGSVVWEKMRRPMAYDALDVPRSAEGITPEWLTHVLSRAEVVGAKWRALKWPARTRLASRYDYHGYRPNLCGSV